MALIIFDWDDTLCPTTWLYDKDMVAKSGPITREQYEWLHVMSVHIKSILSIASTYGHVMILTNASPGWVPYCVKRYFPDCEAIVLRCDIHYAWNAEETDFRKWKKIHLSTYTTSTTPYARVLGVGDRWDDREAVRSTFENKCCVKTVKFMNAPEVRNLVYELMAMGHMMDGLIRDCNNYDIVLCH